eukprot:9768048-Prorocentrum_lima.AAC.1
MKPLSSPWEGPWEVLSLLGHSGELCIKGKEAGHERKNQYQLLRALRADVQCRVERRQRPADPEELPFTQSAT